MTGQIIFDSGGFEAEYVAKTRYEIGYTGKQEGEVTHYDSVWLRYIVRFSSHYDSVWLRNIQAS